MSDEAIINIKLDNIESDCIEIKTKIDNLDEEISTLSDRAYALEMWRNGNGAKGAEARLQHLESCQAELAENRVGPRLNMLEADMVAVQRIADNAIQTGVQGAVNDTLDKRDKTTIAKVKAWGPYFATGVVLILGILERVLK